MRGRAYKARRCTVLFILFCIQSGSFLIYYHWPRHRDADVGIGKVLQAYTPGEHKVEKTYLFYDAGRVYHDMNFTCPVPWGWTQDVSKADAAWFNVLEHNQAAANSVEYLNLGEMPLKVFMSLESKEYYPDFVTAKSRGLFDYIVDYRIWSSNTNPSGDNVADIPAVYLLNPTNEDTAIDFRKPTSLPKRNDAYIAAFISNCASRNGREVYMEQLMKYIPFHSYGRCHHTMDEPSIALNRSNREKKLMIGREYYFWFTAENSNSDSYVTEKVYEALEAGVVPVYFGAPNIERFIPDPSAIIMADRYEPKDLADLLKRIASDPAEYATYFEWKSKPFSKDFTRVLKLASRTVQCRLAMHLEGLDMERD